MAKKSALNLLISKTCVALVNGMSDWKQTSRTHLADFLASVTWFVLARRRKIALTNLRLCFPEWSEQKRVETAKGVFRNLIRAALDHSVLQRAPKIVLDMVKFEGKEQFEALCKTEKVIIVCSAFCRIRCRRRRYESPLCAGPLFIKLSLIRFGTNGLLKQESVSPILYLSPNPTRR